MMKSLLYFMGGGVCHQITERSLLIGASYLPLCARCTGIYLGVVVTFLYLFCRKRRLANQPPTMPLLIVLVLSFLPLMGDGVSSYLGLRETSNIIRLITGMMFGSGLPFFILLIKNYDVCGNNDQPIIQNLGEYGCILGLSLLLGVMVYQGAIPSWYILSILLFIGVYMLYVQLFIGILKQVFTASKLRGSILTVAAYVMAFAWINLLSLLQKYVFRLFM